MNEKCSICFSRVIRSWRWHERFSAIIVSLSKTPLRFACKLKHLCMMAHNCHGKTKHLTAKPKTSRQNQIPHSKNKIGLVLPWVFPFAVRYLVFAVKYLDLSWGLLFCREVFCFCREVFGFAVRFLVLPWQLWATVFMKLKLKIFWLKECRVFCKEKYNSAPSYLRHSRKLAK